MRNFFLLLLITLIYSCNSGTKKIDLKEKNESYLNLSLDEKIAFCKEQLSKGISISKNKNIPVPENSIFFIITDNKLIDSLKLKDHFTLPLIVRFSDRGVNYSGNRFEDANLSQNDVGAAYNYGNYSSGGITRDVQVFETDYELGGTFTPISCGYHTNSLDRYEIYNFADMEEMGGLPGYLDYLWDILDYSKDFGDKISKKEINLINNKNFLFYYNGAFQDKFNNIYLRQLAGISKSTTDNKSSQDSINVNTSEIPENKDTQDIINSQPIEMTDSVKK